jgi:hypothetical protein
LHQAPTAAKQSDPRKASIDFASAIRMLGESLNASKMGSETAEVTDREAGSRYGFRQAG